LTNLKYTSYEIEHMSQTEKNNILLYKIRSGFQIGPKARF